jgi:hypothetical protein
MLLIQLIKMLHVSTSPYIVLKQMIFKANDIKVTFHILNQILYQHWTISNGVWHQ